MCAGSAGASGDVRSVLEFMQHTAGFAVLHDVHLTRATADATSAARVDHVVIDQFGILAIAEYDSPGAVLQGAGADSQWAALVPGGRTVTFTNPLAAISQACELLDLLLRDAGTFLPADAFRGLVVVSGADTSQLRLESGAPSALVTVERLPEIIAARRDVTLAEPLSPERQIALGSAIAGFDRSGRAPVPASFAPAPAPPTYADVAPTAVRTLSAGSPPSAGRRSDVGVIVAIGVGVVLVLAAMAFVLVMLFVPVRSSVEEVPSTPSVGVESAGPEPEPVPQAPIVEEPTGPTVEGAQAALRKAYPDLYKRLPDVDEPEVGGAGDNSTFTWEYVDTWSSSAAKVRRVTVELDERGRLVDIDRE